MDWPPVSEVEKAQKPKRELDVSKIRGAILFENVWFRYPSRPTEWVLRGLTLRIQPNETVALVGESGCGKSTLVALLLRFYEVEFGVVYLDGVDIKEYEVDAFRGAMGLVMQEPTLFNYTIKENILYGKGEATNSEIVKSAEIANAREFIEPSYGGHGVGIPDEESAQHLLALLDANKDQVGSQYKKLRNGLKEMIK